MIRYRVELTGNDNMPQKVLIDGYLYDPIYEKVKEYFDLRFGEGRYWIEEGLNLTYWDDEMSVEELEEAIQQLRSYVCEEV